MGKQNYSGEIVEPKASSFVEALRDIGYSLESAVADIIDNSISANARNIDLRFGWTSKSEPWLAIADDGIGMSAEELVEAMRPGGRDPLGERPAEDLGRFGLGLKTASFSQCRKLTVVSIKNGLRSTRQWDLDYVRKCDQWRLLTPSDEELSSMPAVDQLGSGGTAVVWEKLDRLDLGSNPQAFAKILNERIMAVREHISLVFHRFISGEPGKPRIRISINAAQIKPFDPFNASHPATIHLAEERLVVEGQAVVLKPYILPHHSKVNAPEYEKLGGHEGYLRGQGFYIYRSRRLIIWGTWFRMARQDELTKLARVLVDIPNSLDHLWTIDIRKSRAHPPEAVKGRLRGILEQIRESAKRPYRYRGSPGLAQTKTAIWLRLHANDRVNYTPNIEHPLLSEFRADLPEAMRKRFDGLVSLIGSSIPLATVFNDMAASPKQTERSQEDQEMLISIATNLFAGSGLDAETIRERMLSTELFSASPNVVELFLKTYKP